MAPHDSLAVGLFALLFVCGCGSKSRQFAEAAGASGEGPVDGSAGASSGDQKHGKGGSSAGGVAGKGGTPAKNVSDEADDAAGEAGAVAALGGGGGAGANATSGRQNDGSAGVDGGGGQPSGGGDSSGGSTQTSGAAGMGGAQGCPELANGAIGKCTPECPCGTGEGPCVTNIDCRGPLVCGEGTGPKFRFAGNACLPVHCTDDVKNGGETSQDCGGGCGCGVVFDALDSAGMTSSHAYDVSDDGEVVVGGGWGAERTVLAEGVRWRSSGGGNLQAEWLGFLWENEQGVAQAFAVDGAATTIAGYAVVGDGRPMVANAVLWESGVFGITNLGPLPGSTLQPADRALGISQDGSIVVGYAILGPVGQVPFRWSSSAGYELLGGFDGGEGNATGAANAASLTGDIVVGSAEDAITGAIIPFRWTRSTGMERLGDLVGGTEAGRATGVSDDGTVVVGACSSDIGSEASRWQSGQMLGLGNLGSGMSGSEALGVSGDGLLVVGRASDDDNRDTAFFWDEAHGMRSVLEALQERGFEEPLSDWELNVAHGITRDGKFMVGDGYQISTGSTYAWRIRLEP